MSVNEPSAEQMFTSKKNFNTLCFTTLMYYLQYDVIKLTVYNGCGYLYASTRVINVVSLSHCLFRKRMLIDNSPCQIT